MGQKLLHLLLDRLVGCIHLLHLLLRSGIACG